MTVHLVRRRQVPSPQVRRDVQPDHRAAGSRGGPDETVREPGFAANGSLLVGDKGIIYLDDA